MWPLKLILCSKFNIFVYTFDAGNHFCTKGCCNMSGASCCIEKEKEILSLAGRSAQQRFTDDNHLHSGRTRRSEVSCKCKHMCVSVYDRTAYVGITHGPKMLVCGNGVFC